MNEFKNYEWAEGLSKEQLIEEVRKRNLSESEIDFLWELNGYSHFDMEVISKKNSLPYMISSNAIYWIIGLSIIFLAASVFG